MIALFEEAMRMTSAPHMLSKEVLLATAAQATAVTIRRALHELGDVDETIVSGGGTENEAIWQALKSSSASKSWERLKESAAKEAMAFALLAAATLDGIPSNVPTATGARRAVVLGSITPKP